MTTRRRLQTRFSNADDSTGLVLWRVTNAWQAAQRRTLKPFGLTHVQFVLLASVSWFPEPPTQKELAQHAGTDPMMTSQVLRALEQKGLIQRLPHPHDGRARMLAVTEQGRLLADQAVGAVEASDQEFFAALGRDQARFTAMLQQLTT
ncbi:MAG TPA: MarR family transcriptional regulator [Propionibacteriaceae bacterium]|nr:MarR family transcriptional regulator [Propionibacteriaceae bacterium]